MSSISNLWSLGLNTFVILGLHYFVIKKETKRWKYLSKKIQMVWCLLKHSDWFHHNNLAAILSVLHRFLRCVSWRVDGIGVSSNWYQSSQSFLIFRIFLIVEMIPPSLPNRAGPFYPSHVHILFIFIVSFFCEYERMKKLTQSNCQSSFIWFDFDQSTFLSSKLFFEFLFWREKWKGKKKNTWKTVFFFHWLSPLKTQFLPKHNNSNRNRI